VDNPDGRGVARRDGGDARGLPPREPRRHGAGKAAEAQQPVVLAPENVAVVEPRALQDGPEISGTLRAMRAAAIAAEVGGAAVEVRVEAGERVQARQLLAAIDAPALQDAVVAARSSVAAARNNLQVAEAGARRARMLAEAGAMAVQDAERAEAGLEAARAQFADAHARLGLAEQTAGKTRVRAPFAGVVSERSVSPGDVVAPGVPLFTVIDPTRLQFEASVPAARIGQLKPGDGVDFTVTGFGGRAFQGRIDCIECGAVAGGRHAAGLQEPGR